MLNFDWLQSVSQENAKSIFFVFFFIVAILILLIPNAYIFQGLTQEEIKWWKNLKIWALVVLSSLIYVYYRF